MRARSLSRVMSPSPRAYYTRLLNSVKRVCSYLTWVAIDNMQYHATIRPIRATRKENMATTNKTVVRNKPDELLKIIKALEKKSAAAVETLGKLCADESPKIRLEAAKAILDTIKEMKDQVEKQDLQRILVQAKLNMLKPPEREEDMTPRIDFNTIAELT